MISQIKGRVIAVAEHSITVDTGAVAYEIWVPSRVTEHYKEIIRDNPESLGAGLQTFFTIQYIEGSSGHGNQFFRLVGFERQIEKDFFLSYTGVEGVGYKTALKSLIYPIHKIATAIEMADVDTLKKLPHIGNRTAQKMVATLKGRMQKFMLDSESTPLTVASETDFTYEVRDVLRQVGMNTAEAEKLIARVLKQSPEMNSAPEMIQEIFKIMHSGSNLEVSQS